VTRDHRRSFNYYDEIRAGRYGSMELDREVGRNLFKGLGASTVLFILAIFVPLAIQLATQKSDEAGPSRQSAGPTIVIIPPVADNAPKKKSSDDNTGGGGGGGGGDNAPTTRRGSQRNQPRLLRNAETGEGGEEGVSLDVFWAHLRTTRPGEAETPIDQRFPSSARGNSRRGTGGNGRAGIGDDAEGAGGSDDLGNGPGTGGGAGGGAGTGLGSGIGSGIGPGIGGGRGGGRGGGNGRGTGSGIGDGEGDDGDLLASAKPNSVHDEMPKQRITVDVIRVDARKPAITKSDNSPIVDWIRAHQKTLPATLMKAEVLHPRSGDVTTWQEFQDENGLNYTLYLLGRSGRPAQLNIFLVCNNKGTLLQDEGARGVTEIYKHGTATGDGDNLTVQLSLLPPGNNEAAKMMAVVTAWWNHVKNPG
jgi:hypothetical protein